MINKVSFKGHLNISCGENESRFSVNENTYMKLKYEDGSNNSSVAFKIRDIRQPLDADLFSARTRKNTNGFENLLEKFQKLKENPADQKTYEIKID